ncbi:MAG: hypothetical protein ACLP1X_10805 [Polyangiaceae bacterium]
MSRAKAKSCTCLPELLLACPVQDTLHALPDLTRDQRFVVPPQCLPDQSNSPM